MRTSSPAVLATLALLLPACSGAASSNLFDAPIPSTDATEPAPATPSGSRDGGRRGDGAADASDAGWTVARPDPGTDPADAATPWKSAGVYCGTSSSGNIRYCASGTEVCCAKLDAQIEFEFACEAATAGACRGGRRIECDDRSDCPGGQICCAIFELGFGYRSAQCATSCTTSAPGTSAVQLCDPFAPSDECASRGARCVRSQSLDGFHYCN